MEDVEVLEHTGGGILPHNTYQLIVSLHLYPRKCDFLDLNRYFPSSLYHNVIDWIQIGISPPPNPRNNASIFNIGVWGGSITKNHFEECNLSVLVSALLNLLVCALLNLLISGLLNLAVTFTSPDKGGIPKTKKKRFF